jgi:hypothetical protein
MLELFALGVVLFVGLAVAGVLWAALSLVGWILFLPFKLLGLVFKGFAFLFALPFLLLAGFIGVLCFGAGLLVFMVPVLPFALLAVGAWLLLRRRPRSTATPV